MFKIGDAVKLKSAPYWQGVIDNKESGYLGVMLVSPRFKVKWDINFEISDWLHSNDLEKVSIDDTAFKVGDRVLIQTNKEYEFYHGEHGVIDSISDREVQKGNPYMVSLGDDSYKREVIVGCKRSEIIRWADTDE